MIKIVTPTWPNRIRACLRHNALSSKEYAVLVSGPARCKRKNGAQNAAMENFGSLVSGAKWLEIILSDTVANHPANW